MPPTRMLDTPSVMLTGIEGAVVRQPEYLPATRCQVGASVFVHTKRGRITFAAGRFGSSNRMRQQGRRPHLHTVARPVLPPTHPLGVPDPEPRRLLRRRQSKAARLDPSFPSLHTRTAFRLSARWRHCVPAAVGQQGV